MKKFITTLSVFAIMVAMVVGAQAQSISSKANEWFATVPGAGTVVVKDNKKEFKYTFDAAGTYLIGKQSGYTGQLKWVGFEPAVDWAAITALKVANDALYELILEASVLTKEMESIGNSNLPTSLWNSDACQDLYSVTQDSYHNVWDKGTIDQVKNAIARLEAAIEVAKEALNAYYAKLAEAKEEYFTLVDEVFVLIREIQGITDVDLWNTDACQDLYWWAVFAPLDTIDQVENAIVNLQVAFEVAQAMVDAYYADPCSFGVHDNETYCPVCDACARCGCEGHGKSSDEWVSDIKGAIEVAIGGKDITKLVISDAKNNSTVIELWIDDELYTFVGGNGTNSDKKCVIDGVKYIIGIQGNGAKFTVTAVE